ncbi:hypothetical protein [Hasllibacter sp. MH4015]|uniref:hypothetical protein n=1 Tax=Hasllibacter sp. MH4015 TaxID=2854029 RepID=UPI001CD68E3C|nr:hypothetical protein [Hasllibacter sp. MH4015]
MTQRLSDLGGHAYNFAQFPRSFDEIPTYLANLDPMTAGLILLASASAFLVWAGSDRERRARRARARSGHKVTLPPRQTWGQKTR